MDIKVKRKTKKLVEKLTDFVAWFLGSWWAVVFHTFWFTIWIVFHFDMNILTLGVSLEAIFIGIFLLMAANKAELQRDLKEMRVRQKDQKRMERDISLDEKAERRLRELKHDLREIKEEIEEIKTLIRQTS